MESNKLQASILNFLQKFPKRSFTAEEIFKGLELEGASVFNLLVKELAKMERSEKVAITREDKFKLATPKNQLLVEGVFHGNDRGFGFVSVEDDDIDDIYINEDHTAYALNNDIVEAKIIRPSKKGDDRGPEGIVKKIVERNFTQAVGTFEYAPEPDKNVLGHIAIRDKKLSSYQFDVLDGGIHPENGAVITVSVTQYPKPNSPKLIAGIAVETIGYKDDPGVDILQIIYQHDVPVDFPEDVLEEIKDIPDYVTEDEKVGRVDLTDEVLVTIDGDDSKDFDDAVAVTKLDNGNYRLLVSIADVSHYVKEGSPLDKEAYRRSTSVYLTDRVVPMLPRKLSNGICSLNPDVERLSMTSEMEINPEGKTVKHRIYPSVMRSHARLTYNNVNKILESDDEKTRERYADLVPMLELMAELHKILLKKRKHRGAIEFDDNEAQIIVDETGHPTDIKIRVRGTSERMIESFMLEANETVAEHYYSEHVPFLYRVHETPDGERMLSFFEFLTNFGHVVKGSPKDLKPKMLQGVLKQVAGTPEEAMISVMMLRSMKQAKYDAQSLGHFGLAAKYYTHFTSPIRRYPDLFVHRLIRHYRDDGISEESQSKYIAVLPEIAEHTSKLERRAVDTERDVDAMKKAEFMGDHVGEQFHAVVSSVMKFGLFVELENTVEGLIHISTMKDDYYEYVESQLALVGRNTRRTFQIGQEIDIQLMRVDKDQAEVDFELLHPENTPTSDIQLPPRQQRPRNGGNRGNHSNGNRNFNKNNGSKNGNHKPFYKDKNLKNRQQSGNSKATH
ncbi:ribonuclease R [Pediococcus claussenii]|uniref:Ribonuclease R n=1 Tax=Pediococcus claussenii (strain ATCC BAA-344 / DSM 14800 / JCM 18046 / KCTC 3811 / LMG 21948 / P06) TaxID=701521 RepID=G8PC35_PEDCP|nr:ribonuclease R [Pediococcus claussenii]AEV94854.1 ribonuclease R [Pediococcus claussenii ATCC BAA-344]ANZ70050.1 ribonuclease R [Pediococcus claussenii]ANZ71865.1 ribonuclease R [Pediococcus claussenii]KRN21032.1 rnr protein [Pediococcus claussenii]